LQAVNTPNQVRCGARLNPAASETTPRSAKARHTAAADRGKR